MKYSDQSYNLRIELDTQNCELSPGQLEALESALSPLREPIKEFPVTDLYVTIQYKPPSHDYRVKAVLRLPGKGLATGDLDENMYPAFRRYVSKLVHKVTATKTAWRTPKRSPSTRRARDTMWLLAGQSMARPYFGQSNKATMRNSAN